jgi:hypothetical protein
MPLRTGIREIIRAISKRSGNIGSDAITPLAYWAVSWFAGQVAQVKFQVGTRI